MIRFLAMLYLVCLACSASANDRVLKLASTEYPPYYNKTMEGNGFITQIIAAAFAESGYDIDVTFLPWARALESTKAGKYDGLFTVRYREDRTEFFAYSDPLPPNKIGFLKRSASTIDFDTLADLKDRRIGIVRGYAVPPEFDDVGLVTIPADNNVENLRKLMRNRIDLIVSDRAVALHTLTTELGVPSADLEWLDPAINTEIQYLVFPKSTSDHETLMAGFNAGLATVTADGTVARIIQESGF